MQRKLYAAYGSNLHIDQMKCRCPDSFIIGNGFINDYELEFRYFANIKKSRGMKVPVVVFSISEKDEKALDQYEGVSVGLYRKETLQVKLESVNQSLGINLDDQRRDTYAMVYIMNEEERPLSPPSESYYNVVRQGYLQHGLDMSVLATAAILVGAKFSELDNSNPS